jgi:large subunit ribosomal protein L5
MADDKKTKSAGDKKGADKPAAKPAGAKAPAKAGGAKGSKAAPKQKTAIASATTESGEARVEERFPPRLKAKYRSDVIPSLMKQFQYTNPMQVPRVMKITLNMGLGEAVSNAKIIEMGVEQVLAITGQKPMITRARKSIATFKLRTGLAIGVMVTLRQDRMWEFLDRLVTFALPRVRDFKGVSPKAFDGKGNFTLGVKEQIIFPEINYDTVEKVKGLNISITTTARTDEEGRALLQHLGMPFRT